MARSSPPPSHRPHVCLSQTPTCVGVGVVLGMGASVGVIVQIGGIYYPYLYLHLYVYLYLCRYLYQYPPVSAYVSVSVSVYVSVRPVLSGRPTLRGGGPRQFWVGGLCWNPPPPLGVGQFWVCGVWVLALKAPENVLWPFP